MVIPLGGLSRQERQSLGTLRLSSNFTYLEAIDSSKCPELVYSPSEVIWQFIREYANVQLEEFRGICGDDKPLKINSWYRNPTLNSSPKIGGTSDSIHQIEHPTTRAFMGVAADVVPVNLLEAFRKTPFLKSNFKTLILYPTRNFIHTDSNVHKKCRRWFISIGKGVYDEISKEDVLNIKAVLRDRYGVKGV